MSNILSPTKEQSERTAYWENYIKENPMETEEID